MRFLLLIGALLIAACSETAYVKDPILSARDAELVKAAPQAAIAPQFAKQRVRYRTLERPGTIIIETNERFLYHVMANGEAIRYPVTVGAEAFGWVGETVVQRKAEWPNWTPPPEMLARWPHLPKHFKGGPDNPLGARGIYLYADGKDTLYRIHGTNEPESIGLAESSGCIRMLNIDVIHLYNNVSIGTKVIVR
jgi:lipoprotein-anchoring transpeptidase ErfK/SrfK